jgi:hypothetical protein
MASLVILWLWFLITVALDDHDQMLQKIIAAILTVLTIMAIFGD